jgi:hypothetical protein
MAIDYKTLTELIEDARQSRERVEAELVEAQMAVALLKRQQEELREEEDAYTATLTRRFADEQGDLPPVDSDSFDLGVDMPVQIDWRAMPRTNAVERAIAELTGTWEDEPASPGGIENFLRQRGRDDDRDAIGGAIAHLNRTGKIRNVGRAQWVIATTE